MYVPTQKELEDMGLFYFHDQGVYGISLCNDGLYLEWDSPFWIFGSVEFSRKIKPQTKEDIETLIYLLK